MRPSSSRLRRVVALVDPVAVLVEVVGGERELHRLRVDLDDDLVGGAGAPLVGRGQRVDEDVQQRVLRQTLLLGEQADRFGHVEIAHRRRSPSCACLASGPSRASGLGPTRTRSWPGRSGRRRRSARPCRRDRRRRRWPTCRRRRRARRVTRRSSWPTSARRMATTLPTSRWKCAGRAQRPLDARAGDLERVVARHRVVVVELARRPAGWPGRGVEGDAARRAGRGVERDPQRAAALLDVVQVEPEIGGDRCDELRGREPARRVGRRCRPSVDLLSVRRSFHETEGVGRTTHASRFREHSQQHARAVCTLLSVGGRAGSLPPCCGCRRCSCARCATTRPTPRSPSHRLLVRAGYIRRAAPGGFTWLPLGWIVYRNVERIVREEMDAGRLPGGPLPGAAAPRALRGDAAAGPTTATTCSGSRTAAATTSSSRRPTRRCSRCS